MFWGQHLKQAAPYKLSEHTASSLLHVSNVALSSDSASGKTKVWAHADGHKVLITALEAGKYEHASLDLYFRVEQEVQFSVEGKGEVFIAGYYEPETDNEFGDFDEEGSSEEEGNGPFKALEAKKGKKVAASESSEEEKPHVKAQAPKGQQQPGKPGQQQQPGKPGPVQGQQGAKPVPAQQGGKPGQQQPAQQGKPGQQQLGKPGQQQPGKPAPQQGKPAQAAKKPEVGSSEDDEDLDDEIDDGDMDLGDDDDEDDLGLDEDDDESEEEETHLGKRKGSKESGEGDHVKKQQKGNAGIPNVKQELKGQQGGKPGQQQGGKPGQQGGKPQHQGGQQGGHQGGQQGGKGTPPSQQHKGGQQQHSGGKPGQQHSGGKPQHQGGPHQGGKKNKKQH